MIYEDWGEGPDSERWLVLGGTCLESGFEGGTHITAAGWSPGSWTFSRSLPCSTLTIKPVTEVDKSSSVER